MISIFEACSWLNQFDRRHLNNQSARLIAGMLRLDSSEETVRELIQTADTYCNCAIQPLERAEILLNCAAIQFSMGLFAEADQHILDAKFIYEENRDRHRFAVAVWMAGIVERETIEKGTGHANWTLACAAFKRIADENARYFDPEKKCWCSNLPKRDWYAERQLKMSADLICLPEEIYGWLNKFEPSHLGEIAVQVKRLLHKQFGLRQYPSVYALIGELHNLSRGSWDYLEIPEIMIECGLVLYELGNYEQAVDQLDQALHHYLPHTHRQAVLLWLSGALMWRIPARYGQAVTHWEKAISFFSDLAIKADYEGRGKDSQWYREKMEMMLRILNQHMAKDFSHSINSTR